MTKNFLTLTLAFASASTPFLMVAAGQAAKTPMVQELEARLAQQKQKSEKAGPPARPPLHPRTPKGKTKQRTPTITKVVGPSQTVHKIQATWSADDKELQQAWEQLRKLIEKYENKEQKNPTLTWWNLWSAKDYNEEFPTLRGQAMEASIDPDLFNDFMEIFLTEYAALTPSNRKSLMVSVDDALPYLFGGEMLDKQKIDRVRRIISLMRDTIKPSPEGTIKKMEAVLNQGIPPTHPQAPESGVLKRAPQK